LPKYDEKLAHSILEKLQESFPDALSSEDLREYLPEYKDRSRQEFHKAVDALLKLGFIEGKTLRAGLELVSAANITITPGGRSALQKHQESTPEPHSSATSGENLIFLSHAASDKELAIELKRLIETAIPGTQVFVSSDPEDLHPGDPWVETILENLRRARILIALATERGMARRWVWYEVGAGWSRDLRVIPCCVGKLRKGQLLAPFSRYQALNADEEPDLDALLKSTADLLHLTARASEPGVVDNLVAIERGIQASEIPMLSPEEVQRRIDLVHVSARIQRSVGQYVELVLTNESAESVVVRKISLLSEKDLPLTEGYSPPLEKGKIDPAGALWPSWTAKTSPGTTLAKIDRSKLLPHNQSFETDIKIVVICEVLGKIKPCPNNLRVQVDASYHSIAQIV